MKTRSEMIYDFMVALAANPQLQSELIQDVADDIYAIAAALADKCLENL